MSSPQQPALPDPSSHTEPEATIAPASPVAPLAQDRVIRISRLTYLGVLLVFAASLAPAMAAPRLFAWLPLLPVAAALWIAWIRTTVTRDGLIIRSVRTSRRIEWTAIRGIRFPKHGWARADLTDGTEAPLPAVSFDRLRELADASGGHIPNPYRTASGEDEPE